MSDELKSKIKEGIMSDEDIESLLRKVAWTLPWFQRKTTKEKGRATTR